MTRRILSLLLIPLVLSSQGSCSAHLHKGMDVTATVEHSARPHFHTGAGERRHLHNHSHTHGKDARHHSHHHGTHDRGAETGAVCLAPPCSHDDDAVYFSVAVAVQADRPLSVDASETLSGWALSSWSALVAMRLTVSNERSQPPLSRFDRPLYLQTRSLRL